MKKLLIVMLGVFLILPMISSAFAQISANLLMPHSPDFMFFSFCIFLLKPFNNRQGTTIIGKKISAIYMPI